MRSIPRQLVVVAAVGVMVLTWRAKTDLDVAVAQTGRTITVTRIYTGPDGLSHAEDIEMKLTGTASEMMKATGVQFGRRPPSTTPGDWHTGPRRQFVITLSGRGELEVADGKKVPVGPGHINLIEDTTGKGHLTRNIGPEDRITVTIPLADQTGSGLVQ
jgi:quercetin dioxygenase-like cupin family protein